MILFSYELPAAPQDVIADSFAPDLGREAAALVDQIAGDQHAALIDNRLAAYVAGRDVAIDAGRTLGIVSQPDRITFDDLVASGDVDGFAQAVLAPLAAYADALDQRQLALDRLVLPDSRWTAEIRDGLAIDRLRARFVIAVYAAVSAHLRGGDATADLGRATPVARFRARRGHGPSRRSARHARPSARRQEPQPDLLPVRLPPPGRHAVLLAARARPGRRDPRQRDDGAAELPVLATQPHDGLDLRRARHQIERLDRVGGLAVRGERARDRAPSDSGPQLT